MHWRCNTVFSLRKAGIFDLDLFFLEEGIEGLEERKKKTGGIEEVGARSIKEWVHILHVNLQLEVLAND